LKKRLLLSFDLEEFERAGERGFIIGYEGGKLVQTLCEGLDIPATFFTTASFSQRFPDFMRELAESHEIAFHGLLHADDYRSMDKDSAFTRLSRGKKALEKILGSTIHGFRAPRMRPPSYSILKSVGFMYSSSLHPTYVPGRYNLLRASWAPFVRESVLEIPVSVSPVLRLPLSWIWFRNLGSTYAKLITRRVKTHYVCLYFHPWEFVSITEYGGLFYTRHTGTALIHGLTKFLQWITQYTEPVLMKEFATEYLDSRTGHSDSLPSAQSMMKSHSFE
jgi:peptidoglycan/xylan/chitin deacetylase (PgdA/CDA1 family)